jgi:hypothetical protein
MRTYNVEQIKDITIIWYDENDKRISFMADPENPDYQKYLESLEDEA